MRAGYDRVYSDVVTPIVPDLPVPTATARGKSDIDTISTSSVVIATVFAGLVAIGMLTVYLYAPHQVRTSSLNDAIVASQPTH